MPIARITLDDQALKRSSLKRLTVFYIVIVGLLFGLEASYGLSWRDLPQQVPGIILSLILLQQLSKLYFDRDQKRDHDLAMPERVVLFRRNRAEVILEMIVLIALLACFAYRVGDLRELGDESLFLLLFLPFFLAALVVLAVPVLYRDLRHLVTRERSMRLRPDGLELPEFHKGTIAWQDIDALHVGKRIVLTLRKPAAAKPQRWWYGWSMFGAWSANGIVLDLAATQFNAGAREIALALSTRLRAPEGKDAPPVDRAL